MMQRDEWIYLDEVNGEWVGTLTRDQLDEQFRAGTVQRSTPVMNTSWSKLEGPGSSSIPYSSISRINVKFTPTVEEFLRSRASKPTTVLSGPNNCGKTLLLKQLFSHIGRRGYLIGCNRFSHVDVLNTRQIDEDEHIRYYDNFIQNFHTSRQNTESNELQLDRIITSLDDDQRNKLFDVCSNLLGYTFSLERDNPKSAFSPFHVEVDGENLRTSSTGTRLLLTLLGILLYERFSILLIDEPEIGFSPRIQVPLARFLYNYAERSELCPHLEQLFVVTHSHLFLDREVISNNYEVTKEATTVYVKPLKSVADLHRLQFSMLGNELESLYLPSAIILVEGESDVTYIAKVVMLHIPDKKVAIVPAIGDGEIRKKLNVLRDAFGDIAISPYRDRLFIALDKRHSARIDRIKKEGVQEANIFVWSKNGIEYLYPKELISRAYSCDVAEVPKIDLESEAIEFNGIIKTKKQLAQFIADQLTTDHSLNDELNDFITRVRSACN